MPKLFKDLHGETMSFSIGQVIYVLSDKTQTVLPGIIKEEIHHRSLDGETVSYRVVIGPHNKQRIVDLSTLDGEVYGDLGEVRSVLVARLTAFVDDLCNTTNERANQWYGSVSRPQNSNNTNQQGEKLDPSVLMNEMDQQVSHPQQNNFGGYSPQRQAAINSVNGLRAAMSDPDLNTREIIDVDGTIRKVSTNFQPQQ